MEELLFLHTKHRTHAFTHTGRIVLAPVFSADAKYLLQIQNGE